MKKYYRCNVLKEDDIAPIAEGAIVEEKIFDRAPNFSAFWQNDAVQRGNIKLNLPTHKAKCKNIKM